MNPVGVEGNPARLVLATANPGKAAEMAAVLDSVLPGVEVVPRPADLADVAETAADLEGNARLKARAVAHATGEAALADDTGLEVDALGGAPGVHSARYAGDGCDDGANVDKLLGALAGRDPAERSARFRTVLVLTERNGAEVVVEGTVRGRIADRPAGNSGFGYDPVFVPEEGDGRTFAEMSADEKNAMSHRARALRALADVLASRV